MVSGRTFRSVIRSRKYNKDEQIMHKWIERFYSKNKLGSPFKIEDMMKDCNFDPEKKRDYAIAISFLSKERKLFVDVMETFFSSERFAQLRGDGASDEDIFCALISAAVSWGVYPVWSDPKDRKYKLFDLGSFLLLLRSRAKSNITELNFKTKTMAQVVEHLPSAILPPADRPKLERDGVLFQLPEAMRCDECGEYFNTQKELVKHYKDAHKI